MIESTITINLDYRVIRNVEQLMRWAEEEFSLPAEARGETNIEHFTHRLYHHIGKGGTGYAVVEHNIAFRTTVLEAVIASPGKGWKSTFVSGIAHDYGLHLTFSQGAYQAKRRWWWP